MRYLKPTFIAAMLAISVSNALAADTSTIGLDRTDEMVPLWDPRNGPSGYQYVVNATGCDENGKEVQSYVSYTAFTRDIEESYPKTPYPSAAHAQYFQKIDDRTKIFKDEFRKAIAKDGMPKTHGEASQLLVDANNIAASQSDTFFMGVVHYGFSHTGKLCETQTAKVEYKP